jgi:glycosyltransferase involved in cell wall biosynthesis
MSPTVSFVVPCYKLAHLLSDCVDSILGQTYREFEVLIMDDCSPDNTPEVARSFQDARVKYIRNPTNLGHLHNYNKGIGLSQGKYVWLISADDYLR